jgi:hypothetical protein
MGFELMQKITVRRTQNRFQRFLAKGDAPPFDALHINPISVIHNIQDFKGERVG